MGKTLSRAVETALRARVATLRAVDYLRVSTEEQTEGYGISYTGKRTARYIQNKGWTHVGTYAHGPSTWSWLTRCHGRAC